MKIAVLGAGAWGTALAAQAATRHDVLLWGRDAAQIAAMRASRRNERYLGDAALPEPLAFTDALRGAIEHGTQGLFVIATPMAGLREMLAALPPKGRVVWLCKGFEAGTGRLGHELAAELRPGLAAGVLSGPSFADEVVRGRPTALVAASVDPGLCRAAVEAFHGDALRIYTSADPVGVEVGGAVKNVLAIATGIADGLQLGLNARAALVTRGLAEITRLGLALGAQPETFMGLSGLGDLVLTTTGDLSRNRRVGLALAGGRALAQILHDLGHVAEGVHSAALVVQRARASGVEMPICEAVLAVLEERLTPVQGVQRLMSRDARSENPGASGLQPPPA